MRFISRGVAIVAIAALSACASQGTRSGADKPKLDDLAGVPRVDPPGALKDPKHDNLNAVLWSQTAAENRALATQAFNQAARTLAVAKADPNFSALPEAEQGKPAADAPLAIITDIDETVLDSSAFNADLIQNPIDPALAPAEAHQQFDQRWNDWVAQREAVPMPGAVAFLKQAEAAGVTVFYITNRKDAEKPETCNNLVQAGLPLKDCATQVLTRNSAEANPKDKGARRKTVAATHRVVLVLGDNLGDFADGVYTTTDARNQIVDAQAGWWGERWIILPNPMYGSWEDAISNIQNDAVSQTYGAELERRRLLKGRALRGVDWWANPPKIEEKTK
ncbi:MAG: acid phosphatase [Rhodanobacteraceae bacterium]|jgi:5'-nucleotidase (lipoprotein e(P4) family)|nr:acid phosphatase [Rhodanobacteraceae bacterium]MBL0039721.1 acid phosphatase [Xanthomonadales bacterium]MBP6078530.1 acid phosphatase [Xanthomonadales bacterium]